MVTVNITLPDPMGEYVESRIADGKYADASDHVHDLIREDQVRQDELHVDHLLFAGLDSGEPIEVTEEYIAQKRSRLLVMLASGQTNGR